MKKTTETRQREMHIVIDDIEYGGIMHEMRKYTGQRLHPVRMKSLTEDEYADCFLGLPETRQPAYLSSSPDIADIPHGMAEEMTGDKLNTRMKRRKEREEMMRDDWMDSAFRNSFCLNERWNDVNDKAEKMRNGLIAMHCILTGGK